MTPTPTITLASPSTRRAAPKKRSANIEEAIRLKPDHAEARYNLGTALGGKGQTDEAIRQLQEAVRLKPDYAEAHNNLGIAFGRKGQTDEAINQFQAVIRLTPKNADAHNNLGIALVEKGQINEAITQYQEAIRLARLCRGAPQPCSRAGIEKRRGGPLIHGRYNPQIKIPGLMVPRRSDTQADTPSVQSFSDAPKWAC